jgi:hypothetical protein
MIQQANISLVENSKYTEVNLQILQEILNDYINSSNKIGIQVDWKYESASFPYQISINKLDDQDCIYLTSQVSRYNHFVLAVPNEQTIQIILLPNSTFGDKGKANELCRYIAQKVEGKLELFNNRVMYFYKR